MRCRISYGLLKEVALGSGVGVIKDNDSHKEYPYYAAVSKGQIVVRLKADRDHVVWLLPGDSLRFSNGGHLPIIWSDVEQDEPDVPVSVRPPRVRQARQATPVVLAREFAPVPKLKRARRHYTVVQRLLLLRDRLKKVSVGVVPVSSAAHRFTRHPAGLAAIAVDSCGCPPRDHGAWCRARVKHIWVIPEAADSDEVAQWLEPEVPPCH